MASTLRILSSYWRDVGQLLPLLVQYLSQLFIPLAFEHTGNHTNDQQLYGWIKNTEHVRDMLDTKLSSLIHDVQFFSEQVANYKIEGDDNNPGNYKIRRPLLSDALLVYNGALLSFSDDYGALCKQQMPNVSQMFGLADALYSSCRYNFVDHAITIAEDLNFTDEEWQLEDQSDITLSVDTGCLQFVMDLLDRPTCPLEDLPLETTRRRQQCRQQLWQDMVDRRPHIPVTSYLAYTQRVTINLCLLAWMAANSHGVCQDIPFSIVQSVHDARCYFHSPGNQTCLQSKATYAICPVSRAILLLKCHDFSSVRTPELCKVHFPTTGQYSGSRVLSRLFKAPSYKVYGGATVKILRYKESLNSVPLKYKDFKVDGLECLEYLFIALNIFFRLSTASVYVWLRHLRNLPGKIHLSFQLTGLVQILCSEVLYRTVGFPDLSWAVLIDSALTLLSCLWLNTFCYQMYACVRHLRLPSHLTPAEARVVFRRQVRWALIPWGTVCTACIALEKFDKHYLMHSRIIFIVAISTSIAFNLLCLGLVAYVFYRNNKSMDQFKISSSDKDFSKKELVFLSVNTIILSGICVIIRIGFHQAAGIAQYVYCVHIATMLQGPVLFVFFICNGTTLPVIRNRILAWWYPGIIIPGQELCSAAETNLVRWGGQQSLSESSL